MVPGWLHATGRGRRKPLNPAPLSSRLGAIVRHECVVVMLLIAFVMRVRLPLCRLQKPTACAMPQNTVQRAKTHGKQVQAGRNALVFVI